MLSPLCPPKKVLVLIWKWVAFWTKRKNFWCFLSNVHESLLRSSDKANLGFLLSQVLPTPLVITSLKNPIWFQVNPQSASHIFWKSQFWNFGHTSNNFFFLNSRYDKRNAICIFMTTKNCGRTWGLDYYLIFFLTLIRQSQCQTRT